MMKDFQGPGFSLQIPTDWLITSDQNFQAIFLAINESKPRPNLSIAMRKLDDDVTLADVINITQRTKQEQYENYQSLESIQPSEFAWIHRYQWHQPELGIGIYQVQVAFLVQNILFTLLGTCLVSQVGTYDSVFTDMYSSFRINLTGGLDL